MAKEPIVKCLACGFNLHVLEKNCLNCQILATDNDRHAQEIERNTKASIAHYYRRRNNQLSVGRFIHVEDIPGHPE